MNQLDMFSKPAQAQAGIVSKVKAEPRIPLRQRILDFFKERKHQSFTPAQIPQHFPSSDAKVVRKAITQLEKSRHLIATGANKDLGIDNYFITLNLHRR